MKLDRKQKILITLIILAVAFLAWQIYDMFFASDNGGPAPVAVQQPKQLQLQPISPAPPVAPVAPQIPTTTITAPTGTVQVPATSPVAIQPAAAVIQPVRQVSLEAPVTPEQLQYLRLVNRYQLVRMQRMVADEEAAMVASRARIAELNQQISKTTGGAQQRTSFFTGTTPTTTTGYQLMYIDFQSGQWTATLSRNGRFQEVTAGMTLPDGTQITKIDQNGVVIKQRGQFYIVNFYGTTRLKSSPVTYNPSYFVPKHPVRIVPPVKATPVPVTREKISLLKEEPLKTHPVQLTVTTQRRPTTTVTQSLITQSVAAPATQISTISKTTSASPISQTIIQKTTTTSPTPLLQPQPQVAPLVALEIPKKTRTLTNTSINQLASSTIAKPQENLTLTPQQTATLHQIENSENNKQTNRAFSTDEKELLTLPAAYYTLQIIGSNQLSDLINFIKANQLQGKTFIFHTYYLDRDWYVLVSGVYKTENEALDAIKELPPTVQRVKPWVRTIQSVHEAIKAPATPPINKK